MLTRQGDAADNGTHEIILAKCEILTSQAKQAPPPILIKEIIAGFPVFTNTTAGQVYLFLDISIGLM